MVKKVIRLRRWMVCRKNKLEERDPEAPKSHERSGTFGPALDSGKETLKRCKPRTPVRTVLL